ncbi:MAG TPA: hypothetical protein VEP49_04020 [Acidimicrobiia bacterium]|nr:hypothetical protein [Acidimicrobiia bacterium]
MEPTIALVFSPEVWVERLHRHLADHGGARVRQIVLEPTLALEDEYDTLVVSHRWPGLTRSLVDAVHRRAHGVLGVFDPDEPAGREHLAVLGVDAVIGSDAPVAEFVARIAALTPVGPIAAGHDVGASTAETPGPTVVTGPGGAGTSEVALALTAAVAARGEAAVFVDADEIAPSSAARLGLPIDPNLRTAVDAVAHGLGDLGASLVAVGHPSFDVVCGCPSPAAVAQIRPGEVLDVLAALAHIRSHVIVEACGRSGAAIARAVVEEARSIVGVGTATPIGVTRMLDWVAGLPVPAAPVHVAFNRAPADRYQRGELCAELSRTFTPASVSFLAADRRVERAVWVGALVGRGPFTTDVAALAQTAVPRTARPARAVRRSRRSRNAA